MITGKLLKTERAIQIYKKNKSKNLGEVLEEINIDTIPLNTLKEIIISKPCDPFLYDGYIINKEKLIKLNNLIGDKIVLNFEKYEFCLECSLIYDWNNK